MKFTELARRERPDAVVIAGDIYDKAVPSAEAVGGFLSRFLVGHHRSSAGCGYYDDQRKPRQCSGVNCFRKSPFPGRNIYMVGTAAENRRRIH